MSLYGTLNLLDKEGGRNGGREGGRMREKERERRREGENENKLDWWWYTASLNKFMCRSVGCTLMGINCIRAVAGCDGRWGGKLGTLDLWERRTQAEAEGVDTRMSLLRWGHWQSHSNSQWQANHRKSTRRFGIGDTLGIKYHFSNLVLWQWNINEGSMELWNGPLVRI